MNTNWCLSNQEDPRMDKLMLDTQDTQQLKVKIMDVQYVKVSYVHIAYSGNSIRLTSGSGYHCRVYEMNHCLKYLRSHI